MNNRIISRWCIGLLGCLIACVGLIPTHTSAIVGVDDTAEYIPNVGYLVDDIVYAIGTNVQGDYYLPSWDLRSSVIQNWDGPWYEPSPFTDNDDRLPYEMNKKFKKITKGVATVEFMLDFKGKMDGVFWAVSHELTDAFRLESQNGQLVIVHRDGVLPIKNYEYNKEYGVRAYLNLDNKTITMQLNGETVATNVPFLNAVDGINYFTFSTGDKTKGSITFASLKIHRGYLVNEKFLTTRGSFPDDWSILSAGGMSVDKIPSAPAPDQYSLNVKANSNPVKVSKTFQQAKGKIAVEFRLLAKDKTDGYNFSINNGNEALFSIHSTSSDFCYKTTSDMVPFYNYKANVWYRFKIELDLCKGVAKLFINGKLKHDNIAFNSSNKSADSISLDIDGNASANIDDFMVYPVDKEPIDYVEAPKTVSSSDYKIGMQMCSLWREGTHRGWDQIQPWPDRKPLLGFYDEGTPETADWEIKWMLEHGVDFQMYCWYRPFGNVDTPIKDSLFSSALHDGFFNAKYSDQMDFMILFENWSNTYSGQKEFKENLVPFWIEYYLKDDRYLKINGRPVFGFYSYGKLKSDTADFEDGVKGALDYFSAECIKEGLGDPIFLVSGGDEAEYLQEVKDAGFDTVYSYTWGMASGDIEYQKKEMNKQKDHNIIDVMPSFCMGRDDTAWGLMPGGFTTAETYTDLLRWGKDVFIPSKNPTDFGTNLVMLTTWNEYGEGHYICPAGMNGFGYLDAVRNVFCGESEHKDLVPTKNQLARINVLYQQDRVPGIDTSKILNKIPTGVKRGWYFDEDGNTEDWRLLMDIRDFEAKDGSLQGFVTRYDSAILSPDNLNLPIPTVSHIKIRMKNNSSSSSAQIFYTTDSDGNFDEAKKIDFPTKPFDDGFTDYYVDAWAFRRWDGILKQFRIDPITTSDGSFYIDSVELLYDDTVVDGVKFLLDGKESVCNPPPVIQNSRTLLPIRKVGQLLGGKIDWDRRTQKVSIIKDDKFIQCQVGDYVGSINGVETDMGTAVTIINGSTYVPLRFVAEAFGIDVDYDDVNQVVILRTGQIRRSAEAPVVMQREVLYSGEFDTDGELDGWACNEFYSNVKVSEGVLTANSSGVDPIIYSPSNIDIPASSIKNISIGYRNSTADWIGRVYYITNKDQSWNEEKVIMFNLNVNDQGITQYNIDPSVYPSWKDNISQLRLDLTAVPGTIGVDYVRLEGDLRPVKIIAEIATIEEKSDILLTDIRLSWEFESNSKLDGWKPNYHIGSVYLKDGKMFGEYTGPNPYLETYASVGLDCEKVENIVIKYQNMTSSSIAKLYFTTKDSPLWSEDKCFQIETRKNDNIGEVYSIVVGENINWKGIVDKIRFVPSNTNGKFGLDYIRLNLFPNDDKGE